MAITPQDIEQQTFSPSKRGYDTEEVDSFLEQVATEVDSMLQKIADLKGRLNAAEQELASKQAELAAAEERAAAAPARAAVPEATTAAPAPAPAPAFDSSDPNAPSERQIAQVLIVAQQSADKLVADARDNAERIRNDADAKAREVIRQALAEKQNELDEIDRLKQSREEFRTEYKNLLQHFIDDADAVFPQTSLPTPSGSASSASTYNPVTSAKKDVPAADVTTSGDFGDLD